MSDSLLDLHLDEVPDPTVVDAGEEYQLVIKSAELAPSKSSDRTVLKAVTNIIGHESSMPVFINHVFPLKEDDKGKAYMFKLQLKQFFQAFDIDPANPGDTKDWIGNEGWAILKIEDDQNGQPRNTIAKYIVSKG